MNKDLVGFFARLTPEQKKMALEYRGEETHGDKAFERVPSADEERQANELRREA